MDNRKIKKQFKAAIKKDQKPKPADTSLRLRFRLWDQEDILLYNEFKKATKDSGETVSEAIRTIFVNYLQSKRNGALWEATKDDIFNQINKAIYVRLGSFISIVQKELYYHFKQQEAMNQKLNLILNILVAPQNEVINQDSINNPKIDYLKEPQHFAFLIKTITDDFKTYQANKSHFLKEVEAFMKNDKTIQEIKEELDGK